MPNGSETDKKSFESAIQSLDAKIATISSQIVTDDESRQAYSKQTSTMSKELKSRVDAGEMTCATRLLDHILYSLKE